MDLDLAKADALRATRFLHPNHPVELRAFTGPKSKLCGYYTDPHKLAYDAAEVAAQGVYWTVNEFANRPTTNELQPAGLGECTGKAHIVRLRNLFVDLDPHRPKGAASTEEAHQAAIDLAHKIKTDMLATGWPDAILQDSGNGAYLFWAIDLAPDQQPLVKAVILALHTRYATPQLIVDVSSATLARIARVPGTENTKGDTPRYARVLYIPEHRVEVTQAQLEAFIWANLPSSPSEPTIDYAATVEREKAYLDSRNVAYDVEDYGEYTILRLHDCVWRPGHGDGRPWLQIHAERGVSAGCWDGKCSGKNLKSLRQKLGAIDQVTTPGGLQTDVDDPHYLAQKHIGRFAVGSHQTSVVMAGKMTLWKEGVWQPAVERDIADNVTATIKAEFDRAAGQSGSTPRKVKQSIVRDTIGALRSLSLLPYQVPPFWAGPPMITVDGTCLDARDIVPFENCLLHLQSWLKGGNFYWSNPTPRYYAEHKLAFHFWPEAPEPTRWLQFLNELWDDPACHDLTHEWLGYCMTTYTHLQKMMMMIGKPRAGKGTIFWVMEQMVGGNVASPTFESLLEPHGLAPLLGKQLALLPDAKTLSPKILAKVCARLKAIVGEDLITINPKNLPQVTVRLPVKITAQSNEKLAIPDFSDALQSRQLFLYFDRSFVGKEDRGLKDKLLPELPGIANLALAGLRRLLKRGQFTEPAASAELAKQIRQIGNPILGFVEARCVVDDNLATPTTTLFEDWQKWADDADVTPMSPRKFGEHLLVTYHTISKTQNIGGRKVAGKAKRPNCYVGIGLK